jgi:putative spermidine/putrescine transport system permease protein
MAGVFARLLERRGTLFLLLPALLLLVVFYVLPLGQIAALSIEGANLSPAHYGQLTRDDIVHTIFLRTLWIALIVTVISLILGYPLAVLIASARPRLATLVLLLVVISMWTSILVRSYAWMVILGRQGIVNSTLMAFGLIEEPMALLYNRFSVIVGMVHIMLPFMILPIVNTLKQIPAALPRAALSLGARPAYAFLLVYLPLSMPGIAAGATLVFILSMGFFVTPALLGGLTDTTFVLLIERYVRAIRNWEMASAMSMLLLAVTLAIVLLAQYNPTREPAEARSARPSAFTRLVVRVCLAVVEAVTRLRPSAGGPARSRAISRGSAPFGPGAWVATAGGIGLFFLCSPLLIIIVLAFSDAPFLTFPPPGFSLRWFENFLARPDWTSAAWTSITVGLSTMIVATLAGGMAAVAIVRGSFPGRGLLLGFMVSPVVIPTMVLAIALYYVFAPLGLVGTRSGLVLAHSVLAIPFVVLVVSGALRSTDITLERAARTLGAPPLSAFVRVTLPAIRPAVLTAAFFAFLASFDELVIALFIAGTGSRTLPKRMWEGIREEIDPTIAAVAAMLIGLTLMLILISEFVRGRLK